MEIVQIIIDLSLPVWAIVAVGAFCGLVLKWDQSVAKTLGYVVFYVTMPALLIVNLPPLDLSEAINMNFLLAFGLSSFFSGLVVAVFSYIRLKRTPAESAMHLLLSAPVNGAYLGIPVFTVAFQNPTPIIFVAAYQIITINVFTFILVEALKGGGRSAKQVARETTMMMIKNPLVISVTLGFTMSAFSWSVPAPLLPPLTLLAEATVPLILLALGLMLVAPQDTQTDSSGRTEVSVSTTVKLLLHPLMAGLLGYFVFGLTDTWLAMAILAAALPIPQNSLVYATTLNLYIRRAALITTTTTIGSAFTLTALIIWFTHMGWRGV